MKKILSLLKSGENYQIFVKIIQFDPPTLYKIDFLCTKEYSSQMYQRCSLDDVVLQSKRLSSQISPTKLKSVLVNLARSPDSFVLLRRCEISKAPMKTSKNLAWHGSLHFFCYQERQVVQYSVLSCHLELSSGKYSLTSGPGPWSLEKFHKTFKQAPKPLRLCQKFFSRGLSLHIPIQRNILKSPK